MGVGEQKGKCRQRTIWSPEMDQYFVNLILEQVSKGNRIDDHLFAKRAWRHMTTMFNSKFNSNYEKDVLKNRHKALRNLYRTLTNMLEQKGFTWDESKQMVSADNEVWDEYIKAHPDTRAYRIKTIPYYTDLCKIYKTSEGCKSTVSSQKTYCNGDALEYYDVGSLLEEGTCISDLDSDSLHDILIDEDYEISVVNGISDYTPQFLSDNSINRTRTYWQPPMDRFFIDLMLDQVNKGNQVDRLFGKQAWREMLSAFNAEFGFDYDVDILKNRYKTLRRQYSVIKNLLLEDGFDWDRARQMVIAEDCVWRDYIKAHTEARQYMTRPIPYYEDLCLICREFNSNERDSTNSSHHNLEILDEFPEAKISTVNQSPAASSSHSDQFHKEKESSTNLMIKRQLEVTREARSPKKSRIEDEGMVHAIHEMATAVSSLMDKGNENENLSVVPVEQVIAAIQGLPDMDEELVLDACDFLEDEKKAKTFLALDVKLKKKWLIRKLRPSQ